MKKLLLLSLTLFIANCGYAEDFCHGPTDPEINRCYAAISCAGPDEKFYGRDFEDCMSEYDATVQTSALVQESSEIHSKAETYCKKHLIANGDFQKCISDMENFLNQ